MLNGWFSSSRDFSSSQGSGFGRAGAFIMSILAIADGLPPAGLIDRVARELQVGDLFERKLLLRLEVAGVDVVLVRPFGARAHEAFVHRQIGRASCRERV